MSETVKTKRVYFVRHGETVGNVKQIVQSPKDQLNENGLMQAAKIAERSRNISFQKLISSDYDRAKSTAEAIAQANGLTVEYSSLFRERLGPSQFFDCLHNDAKFQAYLEQQKELRNDKNWHFADEENQNDTSERALQALRFLEEQEDQEIMVVTHGLFLRMLVMQVLFNKKMSADIWYDTAGNMTTTNTGITVCICENGLWKLLTWNDHAHFAE